jgi:hypothetical protein
MGQCKQEHPVFARAVFFGGGEEPVDLVGVHVSDAGADAAGLRFRHPDDVLGDRQGH